MFNNFEEYFRNFFVKFWGKINRLFFLNIIIDMIEICDKYFVFLIFIVDFIVNKINVIDFND